MKYLRLVAADLPWLLLLVTCAPPNTADAAKSAECAAIRRFYDDAQSALIDKGACDTSTNISACVPHVALREAFVASLKENKCPSQTK
jgi:hypothetical protein